MTRVKYLAYRVDEDIERVREFAFQTMAHPHDGIHPLPKSLSTPTTGDVLCNRNSQPCTVKNRLNQAICDFSSPSGSSTAPCYGVEVIPMRVVALHPSHACLLLPLQESVGQIIRFRAEAWAQARYRVRGVVSADQRLQIHMDELDRPGSGRVEMDALLFMSLRPIVAQPELVTSFRPSRATWDPVKTHGRRDGT